MTTIFLNYRTGDESFAPVELDNRLSARFGAGNVFRDSRHIPPSAEFEPEIWRSIAACTVMLSIIGPHWLTGMGTTNRLRDPDDWVRREIEFALERAKPIVGVLVGSAVMPTADDLPDTIKPLLGRQFRTIHPRTAAASVNALVDELAARFGAPPPPRTGTVALVRGASAGRVRDAAVSAGIPAATIGEADGVVRLELPEPKGAVAVAGDFLRAFDGELAAAGVRHVRVALHYDEPVTAGLLDEPVLADVLAQTSGARLVVLVTDAFHRTAVAPGHHEVDRTEFAPVRLGTGAQGWIHVPGYPSPRGVPPFDPAPPRARAGDYVAGHYIHVGSVARDFVVGDVIHGNPAGGGP
jgi:hypothetical protein